MCSKISKFLKNIADTGTQIPYDITWMYNQVIEADSRRGCNIYGVFFLRLELFLSASGVFLFRYSR